jgi:hypothetical protein
MRSDDDQLLELSISAQLLASHPDDDMRRVQLMARLGTRFLRIADACGQSEISVCSAVSLSSLPGLQCITQKPIACFCGTLIP